MSVSAIGAALVNASQRIASGGGGGSSSNSVASAAEEASESPTQTAAEARKGDPVAKRKLAQLQAKQLQEQQAQAPKPSEPGKGEALDQHG